MKKIVLGVFLVASLVSVANEEFIIDKEVTGVNKERLEQGNYKESNIILQKSDVVAKPNQISNQNLKNQKQVIKVAQDKDELQGSLQHEEKKPIWKYIIGVVAVIALGVAL
ncbi:MAG: hypothetical protein RR191_00315 [Cetobacterium sp.]|uniref:hypothetical protein n=1 Tax=unclassified Cetobacterium TaxID=2630983 RepID=UPI00163BF66A|nr:hypothetical protein [Cetobacterium sp. 2A]MBC2856630.1 hypothetical protein [Cetobacterium sp. 2A]